MYAERQMSDRKGLAGGGHSQGMEHVPLISKMSNNATALLLLLVGTLLMAGSLLRSCSWASLGIMQLMPVGWVLSH